MKISIEIGDFSIDVVEDIVNGILPGTIRQTMTVVERGIPPNIPEKRAVIENLTEEEVSTMVGDFLFKTDGPDLQGAFFSRPELVQFTQY